MLVLTRRADEKIYIDGGRVELTVVAIEGRKVRLGFNAPPDCIIDREEIHHARNGTTWALATAPAPTAGPATINAPPVEGSDAQVVS